MEQKEEKLPFNKSLDDLPLGEAYEQGVELQWPEEPAQEPMNDLVSTRYHFLALALDFLRGQESDPKKVVKAAKVFEEYVNGNSDV